ncbi:MAG: prepilin-type N-terminal cleavage/methylation domain-containing protein [Chthoniobacterales bacterium]
MIRFLHLRKKRAAYSLIEVLVAGSILVVAAAAMAAMSLAVAAQQESNHLISRALTLQEQAARLYHLGMDPAAIVAILPPEPGATITFTVPPDVPIDGIDVQRMVCTLNYKSTGATSAWSPGSWTGGDSTAQRSNSMTLVRPTIR